MSNLVFSRNGNKVTTSRLIAWKFGKRHDNVLRSIENMDCSHQFNQLNFEAVKYKDEKGEERLEYIVTKDGFVFIAMGFTGKQAAEFKEEYIHEFNRLEEIVSQSIIPNFTDPVEAARAWADEREAKQQKELLLEQQKPKVKYTEEVLLSEDTLNTTSIAKELGMSAKELNKRLKAKKIQFFQNGRWVLYRKYQDRGYTDTRTYTYINEGKVGSSTRTVWTERGRAFIHWLLNDNMHS